MNSPRTISRDGEQERFAIIRLVHLGAPTSAAELALMTARLPSLLNRSPTVVYVVVCDVSRLVGTDAATLDGLARLQLAARRLGCAVRLCNGSADLHALLATVGLCDVVGLCTPRPNPEISDIPGASPPPGRL